MDINNLIKSAIYKGESKYTDVTQIVKKMSSNFIVSNDIFEDPEPFSVKYLIVNDCILIKEGSIFLLDYFYRSNVSDRLGIFYTNNNIDIDILTKVLNTLSLYTNEIDIITCAWQKITNNNFYNINSLSKNSTHFNIVSQILQCLFLAKIYNKGYKYVSFLEHDVLYSIDHFRYDEFDENVICNMNYCGLNKCGYSELKYQEFALHQMTMKFEFAIQYFSQILLKYLAGEYNSVEPNIDKKIVKDITQSVHIKHGKNFTNHYDVFSENYFDTHPLWQDYKI